MSNSQTETADSKMGKLLADARARLDDSEGEGVCEGICLAGAIESIIDALEHLWAQQKRPNCE